MLDVGCNLNIKFSMNSKFLFSIFFLVTLSFFAQAQNNSPTVPIDSATNKITYSKVVWVDSSLLKLELFSRAREWFAKAFKSSNNVIQMEDKENGKIVGKGLTQVYCKSLGGDRKSGFINFTLSIYIKDGRYKYEITDFYHSGQPELNIPDYGSCEDWINDKRKHPMMSQKATQKISNYFLEQLDFNTKKMIEDLAKAMKRQTKENW